MLEISVLMAQFPSQEIARLSYEYRTLGLGYANIGGLLMTSGIPYDSPEGRAICGALTAIMTGVVLCHLRRDGGRARRLPGLRAQPRRRCCASCATTRAPRAARRHGYEQLQHRPVPLDHAALRRDQAASSQRAVAAWERAVALGEEHGYRNAQATVIAPTGTIGLVMDCDTTGIEPDFALVKFKKLAGGGYFKIINRAVPEALTTLGYSASRDRRRSSPMRSAAAR